MRNQQKEAIMQDIHQSFDEIDVCVHDGVYGIHTGAGKSNYDFIQTLIKLDLGSMLHVFPIYTSPENPNYNREHFLRSQALIENAGGKIHALENGTSGTESYGYMHHWRQATDSLHVALQTSSNTENRKLVVSFDTPFIFSQHMLQSQGYIAKGYHVHVPHSTGTLHDPENTERLNAEKNAYAEIGRSQNASLAAVCTFMGKHLIEAYDCTKGSILTLQAGVMSSDYREYSQEQVNNTMKQLDLDPREPFVLSYGRAMPYKGFHILLDALGKLATSAPPIVLIAAARESVNSYTQTLQLQMQQSEIRGKLLTKFDREIPLILQSSPSLAAVIVPSLEEPFGLIPIENFANPYSIAPVIASATGGLSEQIDDGKNGFLFPVGDSESLAQSITRVAAMDRKTKERMKEASQQTVRDRYDYEKNIVSFLRHVLLRRS